MIFYFFNIKHKRIKYILFYYTFLVTKSKIIHERNFQKSKCIVISIMFFNLTCGFCVFSVSNFLTNFFNNAESIFCKNI